MKIGIVGGGFMGLVLAHEIAKTKATVKVFERETQSGGLATYYDYGSFIWDKFYHVILPTDSHLIALLEDLGLSGRIVLETFIYRLLCAKEVLFDKQCKGIFIFSAPRNH